MSRRLNVVSRAFGSLLALAAVAACSETSVTSVNPASPTSIRVPVAPALNVSDDENPRHLMLTRNSLLNLHAGSSISSTGIFYHGGPVLQSGTKVAAIYWASSPIYTRGPVPGTTGPGTADRTIIGAFLRSIGGSPYYNINSSYTDGSGAKIVNSVTYTQYWANNTNVPANGATVTDADMVSMLRSGLTSGALAYDANTVYAIFTAGTVNLGGGFGTQYCAYHTNGTVVSPKGVAKTVLYAAMPYNYAYPSACTSSLPAASGSTDPGADYEVNTLVHEIEETTTDPLGTAWFDNSGFENADKCAWTWGTTYTTPSGGKANINVGGRDYLVQQNWVNAGSGGCALSF